MKYNEDDNKPELTELKEKDACCPKDKKIDNIFTFCAKALFLELCVYYKTLVGKLHPRTC